MVSTQHRMRQYYKSAQRDTPILARHTQHICRLALRASSLGPQVFIGATRQGTPDLLVCWSVGFAIWVQFEMKFVSSIWVALAIHVSFHIY